MLHSAGKSGSMFGHSLRGRRMRKEFAVLAVGCLALGLMALGSAQTDKNKRPSPPAQATFSLGAGQTITVDYSSPRVKGRKIFGEHEPYGDRKSTRLNSSHRCISYAVFCLKKKKK